MAAHSLTDLDNLRAEIDALARAEDEAKAALLKLQRDLAQKRVRLFEAEGKGSCIEARWNRAWLKGDHAECTRLNDLRWPSQADVRRPVTAEEREALEAEAQRLEAEKVIGG